MSRALRRPGNPRPGSRARASEAAALPTDRRARHAARRAGPGISPASMRHRVNSREALAKLPVLRKSDIAALQKENPPFGGLNVTPPGKARRLLMSPGPIFEPEGEGKDWWGAARALLRRRLPRRRRRAQFLRLSPHARRLHPRIGRACARLRGDSRRRRQYRAAARGDRALQAGRLCRHAGLPQDAARQAPRRPARTPPRSSAALVSGAALPASLRERAAASAASPCCNAMPPPSSASSPMRSRGASRRA